MQRLCHDNGALFILDEMITGFRWHKGGAQAEYGITPDLCAFGKALANGFSVSALAGKREFMRLGGLDHTDKPRVFLLSTTHGAEIPCARRGHRHHAHLSQGAGHRASLPASGERLRTGLEEVIAFHGLEAQVPLMGRPSCLLFGSRDAEGNPSQAFRTLFLQETIRRGVLMPSLTVSYAHSDEDVERTVDAVDGALVVYKRALTDGVEHHLVGRPSQVVQRRYNQPQD